MRLLHMGDLHLGKTLGEFDLIEDQRYILDQILDLIKKHSVDAVLLAGDVYDKTIPSEAATGLLDYFLNKLAENKIKTFIISGNHDSDHRLNYGSKLFADNCIYISAIYKGKLERHLLQVEDEEAVIYLLPFVKASQVRHFFPEEKIESYEDAVRVILAKEKPDKSKHNILVAHQFVSGKSDGGDPILGGSESAGTQSVGTVEKIGYDMFADFDYVALGHIHSPQQVGRAQVRYAGSPLKYSLSEVDNEKSVPIITIEKSALGIELMPLYPMRNLRHLTGKMKQLLDKDNIQSQNDFIYATLTDEDMIDNVMGIFQQKYPNTVKIDYQNSHTGIVEQVDVSKITQKQSFTDLFKEFYSQIYEEEITEEEMEVMKNVAREAGVINETD